MSTARLVSRPFFVDGVVEQVNLPVALLADLDEVGGRLDTVVKPLLALERARRCPRTTRASRRSTGSRLPRSAGPSVVGKAPAGVVDVGVAEARVRVEAGPQPLLRPWDRSSPTRPSCRPRTSKSASAEQSATGLHRRTSGPSNARFAQKRADRTRHSHPRADSNALRRHRDSSRLQRLQNEASSTPLLPFLPRKPSDVHKSTSHCYRRPGRRHEEASAATYHERNGPCQADFNRVIAASIAIEPSSPLIHNSGPAPARFSSRTWPSSPSATPA